MSLVGTCMLIIVFFFNDTATTEIYTLSLHDALPIFLRRPASFASLACAFARTRSFTEQPVDLPDPSGPMMRDRKSTRLNSSHDQISYAVFCLKKKNRQLPLLKHVYMCMDLIAPLKSH